MNKLILFYDDNHITIEGSTDLAYSDDVKRRFQGYNWNVIDIDAHDLEQIEKAIARARREKTRPTIVICRSHIAMGSPNMQDSHEAHGAPLGEEEIRAAIKGRCLHLRAPGAGDPLTHRPTAGSAGGVRALRDSGSV